MCTERMRGEWQLSTTSYNIRDSSAACKHHCVYCYVRPLFERYDYDIKTADMEDSMPVNGAKVAKGWRKQKDPSKHEMYFFPSTSDTFAENASDFARVCAKIIAANHTVLWTTKANCAAVEAIVAAIEAQPQASECKRGISVYVTIPSLRDEILRQYEPHAATVVERIANVRFLAEHGFDVNVMIEPYLSDPIEMIPRLLRSYLSEERSR